MERKKFEEWAIVELFGHQKIAGRVSEQVVGGCSFVRVDIPADTTRPAFTKLLGQGSIYAMTITDKETAIAAAQYFAPIPMDMWSIREIMKDKLLPESENSDGPVCRVCGCTDLDCSQCVEKTGEPCSWVEEDLCSACADEETV